MRNNALLHSAALDETRLLHQRLDCVERSSSLEGTDALQVLALEPKLELGLSRLPALPSCPLQVPHGAGEARECFVGLDRRAVYPVLDDGVRLDDGLPREGESVCDVRHEEGNGGF